MPLPPYIHNIDTLTACPECDLLLEEIDVASGFNAHCPRCGYLLSHPVTASVDKILALSWTGFFLSLPAYLLPILKLELLDNEQSVSLLRGVQALFTAGFWIVALVVLLTSILLPLSNKMLLLYIAWNLKRHRSGGRLFAPSGLAPAFRCYHALSQWTMLEVFILAVMVAAIKLRDMGDLHPGFGLYCFTAVLAVTILQTLTLDRTLFWNLIEKTRNERRS
ncbi:MAG: paraquat-inducible protein A [Gammaproteobacteria bacterium]